METILDSSRATFQKAYLEEWQPVDDGSMRDPSENCFKTVPCAADSTRARRSESKDGTVKHEQPWDASSAPRAVNLMRLLGSSPEPRVLQPSGKIRRHRCLSQSVGR